MLLHLYTKTWSALFSNVNCVTTSKGLIQVCEIQEGRLHGISGDGSRQGVDQLEGCTESMVWKLLNSMVGHYSKYQKCIINLNN